MIDCLVVGLSSFARRRVVPALAALPAIGRVHVASVRATDDMLAATPKLGDVHRDYARAIDTTPPGLVYVSLTNDAHATWAARALERGHHVVIDKPACLDLASAERLAARAAELGAILAEATIYPWHPVVAHVLAIFARHGVAPSHVTAELTPPIPAGDVRYRRALGGGALLDLGPYAASIGRVIWGAAPVWTRAAITSADDEVETAFSLLASYGPARTVVGHFAFTVEYRNAIHLLGPALAVEVPRWFSPPPDQPIEITVRHRNTVVRESIGPADAMQAFLVDVLAAIARADDGAAFRATLLADARAREALVRATADQVA